MTRRRRLAILADRGTTFSARYRNLPAHGPYPDEPRQRRLVAGVQAMNAGAHMAEGTWIAPLQDDDEWTDDHLEVLVAAALDQQAEVAYGELARPPRRPAARTQVGDWPPSPSGFSWQAAIYNTALREFDLDMAARFVGEPAEWNLARRMWEAGVSFFFVDRVVGTQNVHATGDETVEWFRARGAQSARTPGAGVTGSDGRRVAGRLGAARVQVSPATSHWRLSRPSWNFAAAVV